MSEGSSMGRLNWCNIRLEGAYFVGQRLSSFDAWPIMCRTFSINSSQHPVAQILHSLVSVCASFGCEGPYSCCSVEVVVVHILSRASSW